MEIIISMKQKRVLLMRVIQTKHTILAIPPVLSFPVTCALVLIQSIDSIRQDQKFQAV